MENTFILETNLYLYYFMSRVTELQLCMKEKVAKCTVGL